MKSVHLVLGFALVPTLAFIGLGLATSCKGTLPPPPEPDVVVTESGPGGSCMTAAENLHALGCSEAADAGAFAQVCAHVVTARLEPIDVRCMSLAGSRDAARACPGVRCP
jgi:hypothetical protein